MSARRYPVGAEPRPDGVHFRVWAPRRRRVEVALEGGPTVALNAEPGGYFAALVPEARPGTRYRFRLGGTDAFPDPASRFQPDGPDGPSQVVDASAYRWRDRGWRGVRLADAVIYEVHVGAFTPEGTYAAAVEHVGELAALGVTVLEIMPVAEFGGRFGWGYDGVGLFAPSHLYGRPDDLRDLVDAAHRVGLGVILDVVYNHFGPVGNYLSEFAPQYFTDRYENEWGEALNFDGPDAGPVREFFVANARYWVEEFHFDGLRLDATQSIHDGSPEHVLADVVRAVRQAGGRRHTLVIGENEPQETRLVRSTAESGYGLDAVWNDDYHHSAMVALTGRSEAYYSDHRGSPQEFVSAARGGFLFQGQRYRWQGKPRGTSTRGLAPATFVTFLQNHDQVANTATGERVDRRTSPGRLRAATALTLLMPGTPMLFMGQEFAASSPFLYFADHEPDLARQVRRGRRGFLRQFPSIASPGVPGLLALPGDPTTFERSKLDWRDRERHAPVLLLHADLLGLRRDLAALSAAGSRGAAGAVLGSQAFVLRYDGPDGVDCLLLVNFGRDLTYWPAPEPLLAPPTGRRWNLRWSSEDPAYGGSGTPPVETTDGWHLPGEAAILLAGGPWDESAG
jgi:maltooligosyltrehalose trehalohydrolase